MGFTYLPGEAGIQEVDPGAENEPSGQAVQFEAPYNAPLTSTGAYVPAGQVSHKDAPL